MCVATPPPPRPSCQSTYIYFCRLDYNQICRNAHSCYVLEMFHITLYNAILHSYRQGDLLFV